MARPHVERLKGQVKADEARRDRLAAELRANLNKRKERARTIAKGGRATQPTDADKV